MRNNFISCSIFLFILGMVFASCSNDNDEKKQDDLEVDFFLMNEQGEKATTFKSGENIVLCADIKNNTSKLIIFFDEADYPKSVAWNYLDNVFAIYESNGKLIDKAWDGISLSEIFLPSGETVHWQCYWKEHKIDFPNVPPFVVDEIKSTLPKGDYYALFSHYQINSNKIYKINFKIQ